MTHGGLLRQAAFKGLREDKPAQRSRAGSCRCAASSNASRCEDARRRSWPEKSARPQPAAESHRSGEQSGDVASVRLTHPDRVYWPDAGVTKEDLADYYAGVWDWHGAAYRRPAACPRCAAPEGTAGEMLFPEAHCSNVKTSPLRHVVAAKEHDVIAVEKLDDLIALVQSGALEIHVRGSRLGRLEVCDRIVFDLDPGEGVGWKAIVAAAQEMRDRLKAEKLESFVKLSGGKGMHVVVPIDGADWDTAKDFTARVAAAMAADSRNSISPK